MSQCKEGDPRAKRPGRAHLCPRPAPRLAVCVRGSKRSLQADEAHSSAARKAAPASSGPFRASSSRKTPVLALALTDLARLGRLEGHLRELGRHQERQRQRLFRQNKLGQLESHPVQANLHGDRPGRQPTGAADTRGLHCTATATRLSGGHCSGGSRSDARLRGGDQRHVPARWRSAAGRDRSHGLDLDQTATTAEDAMSEPQLRWRQRLESPATGPAATGGRPAGPRR